MRSHFEYFHPKSTPARTRAIGLAGAISLLILLTACNGTQPQETATAEEEPTEAPTSTREPTVAPSPTPVPTVAPISTPDYTELSPLDSFAVDTPDGTFELYLRDAIEQQVALQRKKLDMRIRYQSPAILLQDAGGLIIDIDLIEDRSARTVLREDSAAFNVDIDIRVTFADEDVSTQSCSWTVDMVLEGDLWYVVNPTELLLFVWCIEV